jgi:hypothetical protein
MLLLQCMLCCCCWDACLLLAGKQMHMHRDVQKADMGFCIWLISLYINDI